MKYYKLLTQDLKSHNNTQWQIGIPITIEKEGNTMCTDQVLHCYNHPFLAVLFNPIHADIENPLFFEISVDKIVNSDGLKFASKSQTLIEEIPLPVISAEQKVEFAIRVAKLICKDSIWNAWADSWLDGSDRSQESADAAATAWAVARADANAAAYAAADAAWAVARADANAAAYAAADAAWAAALAARDAARAALAALAALAARAALAALAARDAARTAAALAADAAARAAAGAADAARVEFNRKMIDIIEEIVRV